MLRNLRISKLVMLRLKIDYRFSFPLLFAIGLSCSIDKQDGYFADMPRRYDIDSLSRHERLFESLRTRAYFKDGVSVLSVHCNDCVLIPFCGYLILKSDTVYYARSEDEELRPYLVMNSDKFASRRIEYSSVRADSVTYMGMMYDKHFDDSIAFFRLKPIERKSAIDATYLKFIAIKEGGIRYLTFSNSSGDVSILLSSHPRVVWRSSSMKGPHSEIHD